MKFVTCCLLLFYPVFLFPQEVKLVLPVGHTSPVISAVYSTDGKYIVTASWDGTAKVWQAADGRLLNELKGHTESLTSASFSLDGKLIVTTSKDKTARIWKTSSGQFLRELKGHTDWIRSASFSADGKYLLTASWDSTARIWMVENGKLLTILKGHTAPLNSASFSPDGKYIVTVSKDKTAKIWKASTGSLLNNLTGHTSSVNAASFSPDGKYIVTASADATAKVWQSADGKFVADLKAHTASVNTAFFSADGKYIVTASLDKTAKLWRSSDGELLKELKGHTAEVKTAMFSPDGVFIATASKDGTARIWTVSDGTLLHELTGHSDLVNSVMFSPDSKNIATASYDNTVRIWNVNDGLSISELRGHTSVVTSASFSPDGKYIVAACWDNTAKIWDAWDGRLISNLKGHSDWVNTAQFSADGKYIVTASNDSTARVWQSADGKLLYVLKGHQDLVSSANFSPDGHIIVTTSWDNNAILWNVLTGKTIKELKGHTNVIKSASFSPDGKYIVTASWDKTPKIWQSSDGKLIADLKGHTDSVRTAKFSPDGKYIITASWDKTAKLWQASNGHLISNLKGHEGALNSAIFSPDGKYILTASMDNTARLWNTSGGLLVYSLKGHTKPIASASFSPNGKYILTASWDNTARIWTTSDGHLKNELKGHTGSLKSATFSPDGKYIVTTSEDNTIKKWNALTGDLLYTFFSVDSTDYLAIDKWGHYDGTEAARKLLYYVCENEIVDLEQFKDLTWEPGLVSKLMDVNKEPVTAKKLSEINICNFAPVVEDKGLANEKYYYQITPKSGGLGEVQLYVNGKLVESYLPSLLKQKNNAYFLEVDQKEIAPYFVTGATNNVIVKATTQNGAIQSRGATVATFIEKKAASSPNMYLISIGVSQYKGAGLKLAFASKDAIDFSSAITASAQKLLNTDAKQHVFSYTFNTETGSLLWPAKTAIEKLIDTIAQKAKADDILIVFFAGHGVLQAGQKNFYLLTADASAFEMSGVEKEVAISTDELKEWLRKIKAAKQVLILDACGSGQAIENLGEYITKREVPADQQRALENLKDKTGTFILSASSSTQSAYEIKLFGQGLLTYSLLSGIKLGNGLKNNRFIDITKWFNFASDNVRALAKESGVRQNPQILGNASFDVGLVDKEVTDGIKLLVRKKVFRRSKLIQDAELLNDDLELSSLIDKELNNLSEKGKESPLVFVAENNLPDAYSVRGKYSLTGNAIAVTISIFKGQKEKINGFEMAGTADKKEELARKIVDQVQKLIAE